MRHSSHVPSSRRTLRARPLDPINRTTVAKLVDKFCVTEA